MTTSSNTNTNESVLRTLRSLMPVRSLNYAEALQVAERQANRLLALHDIHGPAVPIEIVTEQPRISVELSYELPTSGSAYWNGRTWVIAINASEFALRQRYTLLHEYKHILDHPFRHLGSAHGASALSSDMQERVADYFAACVLMPKAWVKAAYCGGLQDVARLADRFEVSPKAMNYRLNELGLRVAPDRCTTGVPFSRQNGGRWTDGRSRLYERALSAAPRLTAEVTT
jgi:Zn-dependent peptidase ImmA (M78 family)